MVAGDSAGAEARRQLALAQAHEQAATQAREAAGRYRIAERTERRTASTLSPLSGLGYVFLADRCWPGSRRAQVDLLLIGPGGVFIVDTKAWAEVSIISDRVMRGQDDVTDDLLLLADLADTTQADLVEIGLAPGEVHSVAVLAGRSNIDADIAGVRIVGERDVLRWIAAHGTRLTSRQIDTVLARCLNLFGQVAEPAPVIPAVPEPVEPLQSEIGGQDALLSPEEINDALLQGVLAEPIEEWMSFLHPQQAKLIRRSFPGPSRIRGPAGTGKTVVGLHRAAYLARTRPGRILVTTYVRTLPDVLGELLRKLAPDVVDRVDFTGTHAFARRVLQERGISFKLDPAGSRAAFETAWQSVGASSVLAESVKAKEYWAEEIDHVLKGRGIHQFEQYADLARAGRRHRLGLSGRQAVWNLYCAYDLELRRRGINDFADLVLLAEAELRREPMSDVYSAVIVDEVQDLSCAMVRLLHSLVGDQPDGFTLIGDGQQSIYPGGYTLAEAGLSVAGRGVVLDINYRNTAQIVSFAQRLVNGDEYPDIEGLLARGDVPSGVPRNGPEPVVAQCTSRRQLNESILHRIRTVTSEIGTGVGDVAVLCTSRWAASAFAKVLRTAGVPVVDLQEYSGVRVDAVKVGTIKRAKGLEFKQVLIPDLRREDALSQPPSNDSEREHWELRRRELYVAMTRARDGLWVGVLP